MSWACRTSLPDQSLLWMAPVDAKESSASSLTDKMRRRPVLFSFTYTPLQALYPVECLETTSRAKGMAMYAFTVNAISFINLYATPIALGNIKNNYIYVFVGWDFIEALLWYLFAVETQGRTLEELEDIFSSSNPVKASKQPLTPRHPEL